MCSRLVDRRSRLEGDGRRSGWMSIYDLWNVTVELLHVCTDPKMSLRLLVVPHADLLPHHLCPHRFASGSILTLP